MFAAPVNDHWDSSEKTEHVETCGGFCLVLASFKSPSQFVMDICNTKTFGRAGLSQFEVNSSAVSFQDAH